MTMKLLKTNYVLVMMIALVLAAGVPFLFSAEVKEFKRNIAVSPDTVVSVQNVNGNITVESWDKNEVNIYAKIQASSQADLDRIVIQVNQTDNHIAIITKYGDENYDNFWSFIKSLTKNLGHFGRSNVDFYIKAPAKTNFKKLESVNGNVVAKKIYGVVFAETVNGSIELTDIYSMVNAETVNGSITVSLSSLGDSVDCQTVNGAIKLYLPETINAQLSAETVNGAIKSDFPVTISGKIAHKSVDGTIGKGGTTITLETVNGSISVLKLGTKAEAD
jgi:Toastrack DUF4097